MGDCLKAVEYYKKHIKITKAIGDQGGEGKGYGNLEARTYHNLASVYYSLKQFENAVDNFVSALDALNSLRHLLKSEDDLKIKFRQLYNNTYTGLCCSLLKIGKVDEALFAAEQGRAQALSDNLLIQYKLDTSLSAVSIDTKELISRLLTELSAPTIFLATYELTIYIWFLRREKEIVFRHGRLEGDRRETDPISALLRTALKNIGAEFNEKRKYGTLGEPPSNNPFQPFYDAVIGPIVDLLEPQDVELVIVPDGPLCFIPWATIIESIRIRTVPSLTSYQLISSAPEGHHKKTGALLVGNPCLDQLNFKEQIPELDISLTYAQEEVQMIASILNTSPLTGSEATKAEVIKQMSSVGVIHIAAHGSESTGEIFLSPNPGWTSKFPQEKDFILKMSDVQAANLRARLVVLNCCHTGRGRIFKGEGVVGIARAFLAAGARSVLVTLWKVHDEAAMVFMKSFYQLLKEGKTASAAVHQSMKCLRESERFSEMRYWAPFQLIGDDVKIEFEADDDIKK
ncbi:tetratricopeptide repeat protein 28-like [Acropora millepora]|uniref:tetratricopeptide repeat protein 28-like n=1 Tax=Acropora millepora TaxID=45264 RepID=UPI001CF29B2B|nr:tetratricopeptide repeat protein 28-like [Acropora millepora]